MDKFSTAQLSSQAQWTELFSLPAGEGEPAVAYDLDAQGGAPRGPEALTATPDGAVYLLDSVQGRVHTFAGKYTGTLASSSTPSTQYARDLVATAEGLCVLDEANQVTELTLGGEVQRTWRMPDDSKSENVPCLGRSLNGGAIITSAGGDELAVERLPSGPIEAPTEEPVLEKVDPDAEPVLHDRLVRRDRLGRGLSSPDGRRWLTELTEMETGQLVTEDGATTIPIEVQGAFGSARILGFDRDGQVYLLVEDLFPDAGALGVEATLQRYHPEGKRTGVTRVPIEEFVTLPNRPVEVLDDGTVYAFVPRKEGVTVYQVELGEEYASRIPAALEGMLVEDHLEEPVAVEQRQAAVADAAAMAIVSRKEAYDRADRMATELWLWYPKYDYFHHPEPHGTPRPADAWKPVQLVGLGMWGKAWGIPYTWGGFDSWWSRSDHMPWANWADAQNIYGAGTSSSSRGPLIGKTNVGCSNSPGGPCYPSGAYGGMAGIDCSGFVAAAANYIPQYKPGTGTLAAVGFDHGKALDGNGVVLNVQPMNYFVSAGHVMYYVGRDVNSGGMATLEATVDGNPQAAKKYVRSWAFVAAYFPHHRAWWPKVGGDSPGMAFTAQGPGKAEYLLPRQSVWYAFTVSAPTTVRLRNIAGGYPNLFVYRKDLSTGRYSLYGSSMNDGFGDEAIPVQAGTYWARIIVERVLIPPVKWTISW